MRSLLIAVVLLFGVVAVGFAQDPGGKSGGADDEKLTVAPDPIRLCAVAGKRDSATFLVTNNTDRTVVIRSISINRTGSPFAVSNVSNVPLQVGESRRFGVLFAPPANVVGLYQETIEIKQASNGSTNVVVLGDATPKDSLSIKPDVVTFSADKIGDADERCVFIINTSCGAVEISSIQVDAPFERIYPTNLPLTIQGKSRDSICIRYENSGAPPTDAIVRVRTAGGALIPFVLHVEKPHNPRVQIRPMSLSFDSIPVHMISDSQLVRVSVSGPGPGQIHLIDGKVAGADAHEFIATGPKGYDISPGRDTFYVVRFAPDAIGYAAAELHLIFAEQMPGEFDTVVVPLNGIGLAEAIQAEPRDVDLGSVVIGDSAVNDSAFVLRNLWHRPVDITSIDLVGSDSLYFSVTKPTPGTLLPNGPGLKVPIHFIPNAERDFEADVIVHYPNGGNIPVRVHGRGVTHLPEIRRVWIDSTGTYIPVNQIFTLTAHIAPALTAADDISKFRLTLRVDHRALFPRGPRTPSNARDTLYYLGSDTVIIERLSGPVITGNDLVGIDFMGLVTGQTVDTVEMIDAQFPGHTVTLTTGNGRVLLSGCDVGSGLDYSKPIAAQSAWPVPARGSVSVRYVAPNGSQPWVRIVDVMGREVRTNELPQGTGTEQTTTVAVDGLGSGTYFVELHASGEMSVVRVVVGG